MVLFWPLWTDLERKGSDTNPNCQNFARTLSCHKERDITMSLAAHGSGRPYSDYYYYYVRNGPGPKIQPYRHPCILGWFAPSPPRATSFALTFSVTLLPWATDIRSIILQLFKRSYRYSTKKWRDINRPDVMEFLFWVFKKGCFKYTVNFILFSYAYTIYIRTLEYLHYNNEKDIFILK